jgi:hypothetical protein
LVSERSGKNCKQFRFDSILAAQSAYFFARFVPFCGHRPSFFAFLVLFLDRHSLGDVCRGYSGLLFRGSSVFVSIRGSYSRSFVVAIRGSFCGY